MIYMLVLAYKVFIFSDQINHTLKATLIITLFNNFFLLDNVISNTVRLKSFIV